MFVIVLFLGTATEGAGTATGMTAAMSIPAGSNLGTPAGWADALLQAEGMPLTSCNISAIEAWEQAEGGGFGNQAAGNPLNVNPPATAGWAGHEANGAWAGSQAAGTPQHATPPATAGWPGHEANGAWAFDTPANGLKYTIGTLNNGNYSPVLAALRAGNNAQAVMNAIETSPWAASHYNYSLTASCSH